MGQNAAALSAVFSNWQIKKEKPLPFPVLQQSTFLTNECYLCSSIVVCHNFKEVEWKKKTKLWGDSSYNFFNVHIWAYFLSRKQFVSAKIFYTSSFLDHSFCPRRNFPGLPWVIETSMDTFRRWPLRPVATVISIFLETCKVPEELFPISFKLYLMKLLFSTNKFSSNFMPWF